MCGIAGIIQQDTSLYNLDHLQKMTMALSHRGPDGDGFWQNQSGQVIFGHRRLSIIDLTAAAAQPFHYLDRYTIIHNGEIYNYVELKEQLVHKGYTFKSQTDTEVIAAAFDQWREDCLDRFDGMFAFAIWDEKEKKFFAARDRFGEKPFFFIHAGASFLFASEMKALWTAGIDRTLNRKMLFNFLTIGYTDNPAEPGETFYEGISKLPPACFLQFDLLTNTLVIEKYWDIDPEVEDKKITDVEALEKFGQLFTQSVQRRLRSDVPIGTSLSGGLDSSSVVSLVSSLHTLGYTPKAFTAIFPGFEKNEWEYAQQVAGTFGLDHHGITISAREMLEDWPQLVYHQEEPFGSASIYAQFKLMSLAQKHDTRVLLDGQGADEILGGYSKYYKWYWQELFRNRRLFRSRELRYARAAGVRESFDYRNMIAAYFPEFASVVLERQYLLKAIRHEDLAPEFVKLQSKEAYYTTPPHFTLNGALYFNTCIHGLEELLRYADRNAMAYGRETRLPFLSHELAEFVFSLPAHYKIRKGWSKWLLRECMQNKLPESIVWRKDKVGFEPPQQDWMNQENVQDGIRQAKQKLVAEKILRPGVMDKKIVAQPAHAADNFDWRYFSAAACL